MSLFDTQLALEQQMAEEAVTRQRSENQKAEQRRELGDTKIGRSYVKSIAKAMHEPLSAFMYPEKKVGRHQTVAKLLKDTGLEVDVIAYLTVKAVMNLMSVTKGATIKRPTMCIAIADLIHDEWRVRVFADTDKRKALLKKLFKDFDKRTYPREWRKRTIQNYFDAEQLEWEGWDRRQKAVIGYVLLTMMQNVSGFFVATKDVQHLEMAPETFEHVKALLERQASSFILYKPMVVPPKPWTDRTLWRGGYLSKQVRRYPIVKHSGKRDVERFSHMDWSQILPPINALQATPWRVNREMLACVDWAYNDLSRFEPFHTRGIGKMVSSEKLNLPPEPEGYRTDEEVKKRHNLICFRIHSKNRENISKRKATIMAIGLAKQFAQFEAIYFPHNLDSRGRAYPVPPILNPQGPDYVKAMLEFAQGEPVETEEQLNWLAIAGANAYGKDKISLEERVQWVRDNEELILSVASDWKHDLRWTEAGEPFAFVRFCLEWAQYKREGLGFLSHMVVPVDATCSGLQHFSAMLRDEVGGRSVNLIPGLARQDVYGDVAKVVEQKLKEQGTPEALNLLAFGIDRKITKKQVMVVPYAGKQSSCREYTKQAVIEKLEQGAKALWDTEDQEENRKHLSLLAGTIWDSIDEVVVKAKEAMNWLTGVAKEFSNMANGVYVDNPYDRRMTWYTPDGFEVVHYREDEDKIRVKTRFDGAADLQMFEYNGRLNVNDMKLAIAPNFVHALDATHLRLTIRKAQELGIHHFGMVHDSFGVHARYMPQFVTECVKPTFVQMYEDHDVLEEFAERFRDLGMTIEELPKRGTLDLRGVLESEFFSS